MRPLSSPRRVLCLVATFTVIQLLLIPLLGFTPYPDCNGYIALAQQSTDAGGPYPVASQMSQLAFLWNIGAVNMTQLSLWIFGSVTPLLILYALMKGTTAWMFYQVADRLAGAKIAFVALVIYLLYPANYGESTSLLSELPFMFFSMAALYAAMRHHPLMAGVLLAAANWFRPMALVFVVVLIALYIVRQERRWRRIATLMTGYVLTICVIGGINYLRTGRFFYQAATGWMALMQYSWDHDSDTAPDRALFVDGEPNVIPADCQYDVLQKDSVWRSHFFTWLGQNTGEYLLQMPEKLARTYVSDNTAICAFLPEKNEKMYQHLSMETLWNAFPRLSAVQWLALVNLLFYYLLLVGAVIGLFRCVKSRHFDVAVLCVGVILVGTAVLLFFGHGESRFHIPFMPFFILLSAWALSKPKKT